MSRGALASVFWLRDVQHSPGFSFQDVEACGGPAGVALHPGDAGSHGYGGALQGAVEVGDPDQSRGVGGGDEITVRVPCDPGHGAGVVGDGGDGFCGVGVPDDAGAVVAGGGDESAVRAPGDPCNAMVVLPALTRP